MLYLKALVPRVPVSVTKSYDCKMLYLKSSSVLDVD